MTEIIEEMTENIEEMSEIIVQTTKSIEEKTLVERNWRILKEYYSKNNSPTIDLGHSLSEEDELYIQELEKEFISLRNGEFKTDDMKLDELENWEFQKRRDLAKLVKEVVELQELDDKVDDLEELIKLKNIDMNEIDFATFCQTEMANIETNADFIKFCQTQLADLDTLESLDFLNESSSQTPKSEQQQNKRFKISATSTPISRKPTKTEIIDKLVADDDGMVVIGPNGTMIAKSALQSINWSLSGAALTRKILMEVFDRQTLAFHTLTGKPSPAFMDCDKPMKNQLDPLKVADIIHMVTEYTELSAKEVRNAITTKCADENKMFRQREKKRQNAAFKLKRKRLLK